MNPILLIVDDEPIGHEVMDALLRDQGYLLEFAASGAQALEKARESPPDLILLDVMMPDMDGFEVCRRLRADAVLGEIPILMVTALDDRSSRIKGLEAGADDFITKPIDRAELRARVRTITRLNRFRHLQEERSNLEHQLQRLTALRTIDMAIRSSLDLRITLNILLQQVTSMLNVDAASILLLNHNSHILEYAAGRGFKDHGSEHKRLRLGEGLGGTIALERRMIHVPDLEIDIEMYKRSRWLRSEGFRMYVGVPLVAQGQISGILEVFHRSLHPADTDWLNFLEALSDQAAIAINNNQLFEAMQRSNFELTLAYDATIEGWSHALELRDRETVGHTQRVTERTLQIAQMAGIAADNLVHIRRGALLHDIGKLGVPDEILQKPGALSDAEWVTMRKHTTYAYELLSPIAYLRPALDIPYYHHERWDGTGYPTGLTGTNIPLAARLFAVVDVWDALSSDRCYRPAWPGEKVRAYIKDQAGRHFDPHAVELFLETLSGR
jgi:response regulator RpfG family c-di-GMP phosphodiesterase